MDRKSKITLAIISVVVLLLGGVGAFFALQLTQPQDSQNTGNTQSQSQSQNKPEKPRETYVTYSGLEGKTALELLLSHELVETKVYSGIGEMVVSINGTKAADSAEFWAFYVDGKKAQVGADQYVTKGGEKIEWKLEKIQ